MATKQNVKPEGTSQRTRQKDKVGSEENQVKLIPIDYWALVLVLSSYFGEPGDQWIANFWNENRKLLRTIFSDFPEFDISEDTVKKILMTTSSWRLVDVNGFLSYIDQFIDHTNYFLKKQQKSADLPFNIRGVREKYFCLFEIPTGTAFGLKVLGRQKTTNCWSVDTLNSFIDLGNTFISLDNTVVSWNVNKLWSSVPSRLIDFHADYFLPLNGKNSTILKEVQESFKKCIDNKKEVSDVVEDKNGNKYELSIQIVPTIYLNQETKNNWVGLKEGSLLKVILKKGIIARGQESYFISSLPFKCTGLEEFAIRAIGQYLDKKDVLEEVMKVDCHFDIGAGRNAVYLDNCQYLKTLSNRLIDFIGLDYIENFSKNTASTRPHTKRKLLFNLLNEIHEYYEDILDRQAEREIREEEYESGRGWFF